MNSLIDRNDSNSTFSIRNFRESDFPALGAFHNQTAEGKRVIFWWVGSQDNWPNVYCAFDGDAMIAKGQVETFSVVPENADPSVKHRIFFNIKTLPAYEKDTALLSAMYDTMHARALELKAGLPASHDTLLCFGNFAEETDNTAFFAGRPEFFLLKKQYRMCRDLNEYTDNELPQPELPTGFEWQTFDTLTAQQADDYLALDLEIWPETPLGAERLADLAARDQWRLLQIHNQGRPVASLMYWIADNETGEIEEVLVREPYRRQGLASALLARALHEIHGRGCEDAELDVEAMNENALSVYKSAGFEIETEEHRYATEL
ncbi:GNAT family N-acetyltransferase [Saccharibacillus sacchari]|uniref:GNAT family N-acetyltransferase n=1 Tax=Saccharibacillus sacchari TaxID=456493 RepID=UPI00068596E8|nr:GNAT family N-acetyltransferase [Saccharibacillus sacchari]